MNSFEIVTIDKSPKLIRTFTAPRICGHKPFKIFNVTDPKGNSHITFCVNNLAFLLNLKFYTVSQYGSRYLFEYIFTRIPNELFFDSSRRLYYCELSKLPLVLETFLNNMIFFSAGKDSIEYFIYWLNEKILPKFEKPVTKETDTMPINFKKPVYAPATSSELPPTNADNLRQKVIEYSIYLDTLNQLECDNDYDSSFIDELRRLLIGEFDKAVSNYANSRKSI